MAHVSLNVFLVKVYWVDIKPNQEILECTTDFSFLGCSLIVAYL